MARNFGQDGVIVLTTDDPNCLVGVDAVTGEHQVIYKPGYEPDKPTVESEPEAHPERRGCLGRWLHGN